MPAELDGKVRAKLREAILVGFDSTDLEEILKFNNWRTYDIPSGDSFGGRVSNVIDAAFREGWLVELCDALAEARKNKADVFAAVVEARDTIVAIEDPRSLTIVFSSVEIDSAWKKNLNANGNVFEVLKPYIPIDTLDRRKQSKDNMSGVLREIDDAKLFVAFVSKHYKNFDQAVIELDRAFAGLAPSADGRVPARRVLVLVRDQDSRDWIAQKQKTLDPRCQNCLAVADLSDNKNRNADANGLIAGLGKVLREHFDGLDEDIVVPPPPPVPDPPAPAPGTVIVLGEPKAAAVAEGALAADELVKELATREVPYERWADGWRTAGKPVALLSKRPLFVRTVLDKAQSNAAESNSQLTYQLKAAFGFEFDDEGEGVRPLLNCPKVLWRPNGPDWTPEATGPALYSTTEHPAEFARWLAKLLRIQPASGAVVHYEDPTERGNLENSIRRMAVEDVLLSAMTNDEPPLHPDSAPFGYDQLLDVINSVGDESLTVIAAHDLRTPPGSREATIERFREIDRRIDQTLASKRAENAPLMRVAVLLRNPALFPSLEFTRNTRVRNWQLLRMFKKPDGTYAPDPANVERLREYAADLARRQPEQRAP